MKQVCSGDMLVAGDCRMAVGSLRLVTVSLKHMTARSNNNIFWFQDGSLISDMLIISFLSIRFCYHF